MPARSNPRLHALVSDGAERTPPSNRFPWPKRLADLLGKITDLELAKRAGILIKAVQNERRRRGIPATRPKPPSVTWTRSMQARLGEESDRNVALELGISKESVTYRRRSEGIPAFGTASRPARELPAHALRRLGKVSDRALAKELGLAEATIAINRKSLGIPPLTPWIRPIRWTKRILASFDRMSDIEIARRFRLSKGAIQMKRVLLGKRRGRFQRVWSAKEKALLGKLNDGQVALRLGLSSKEVWTMRRYLGISPENYAPPVKWTKVIDRRLGNVPDHVIASELGCSEGGVRAHRELLGIAAGRTVRRWTRAEERLLGTATDGALAHRFGCHRDVVRGRRVRLGIAPFSEK